MTGEQHIKFQRSIHAPDGIHDADLRANQIPMTLKDKLYLAGIALCYIASCTMAYYWG